MWKLWRLWTIFQINEKMSNNLLIQGKLPPPPVIQVTIDLVKTRTLTQVNRVQRIVQSEANSIAANTT